MSQIPVLLLVGPPVAGMTILLLLLPVLVVVSPEKTTVQLLPYFLGIAKKAGVDLLPPPCQEVCLDDVFRSH